MKLLRDNKTRPQILEETDNRTFAALIQNWSFSINFDRKNNQISINITSTKKIKYKNSFKCLNITDKFPILVFKRDFLWY